MIGKLLRRIRHNCVSLISPDERIKVTMCDAIMAYRFVTPQGSWFGEMEEDGAMPFLRRDLVEARRVAIEAGDNSTTDQLGWFIQQLDSGLDDQQTG